MEAMLKSCAGLDVHKKTVVCTVLKEDECGNLVKDTREYATFRSNLRDLASWLKKEEVEMAVMESTGIYWRTVYDVLEEAEVKVMLVNAQHVKKVPGRKTDVSDSQWLAELSRCGLLRASFIPPRDMRQLRLLTRYRRKLIETLAGEKNRLQKVLEDGGVRLSSVVSDIDGVSAGRMIDALIEGDEPLDRIAKLALGKLRDKQSELRLSLEGNLSDRHRLLLKTRHILWLHTTISEIDAQVVAAMEPYKQQWGLLQTIPGVDEISAAMLLAEVGTDMSVFGSKDKICSWAGICPGNNESGGKKRVAGQAKETGT
ncbi:IS110 family transposase [Candidatus Magnetominusculus xianensis]|uniref:Transposase n=1 Tax=Candidatus Magnetominusculus xianensis TaxID=1748249 RepID=A0ABR5SHF9_9BACT|nr:IS110 family transposase [Candidatus Magnetominusculus xianensis]KWT87592.1 transposase [Candidatus Magnetominusculus xianensis]